MTLKNYTYAVGKRKTATAQVRLYVGKGDSTVNGKPVNSYITRSDLFDTIYSPFKITNQKDNYYFEAIVKGSGENAQIEAVRHGITKALVINNPLLKKTLKDAGFVKRDARIVERKKPGLHGARKSPQWSKR